MQYCDVLMLRGPLTAYIVKSDCKKFGDPGLLAKETYGIKNEQDEKFGLILHYTKISQELIDDLKKREPRLAFIDVNNEPEDVVRQISKCSHIYSSSLHGLIVADSLGIPNTWIDPPSGEILKFYDYAASIERPTYTPIHTEEIIDDIKNRKKYEIDYMDGINKAKETILETGKQLSDMF